MSLMPLDRINDALMDTDDTRLPKCELFTLRDLIMDCDDRGVVKPDYPLLPDGAHRAVRTLIDEGYLTKIPGGKFRVYPKGNAAHYRSA